jgi:serine/threonine kinase 16
MPANRNGTVVSSTTKLKQQRQEDDDDENDERFPQAEGDAEGGYSYDGSGLGSSVPLVTKHRAEEDESENDIVFDGDEQLHEQQANSTLAVVPYAHRDLKPGYVILRRFYLFISIMKLTLSKLFGGW